MQRLPTRLEGPVLLAPSKHGDERGFFIETYRADSWAAEGVPTEFVQDNHSRSRRGTVRGLHFQTHPGQGKLVRAARGSVLLGQRSLTTEYQTRCATRRRLPPIRAYRR